MHNPTVMEIRPDVQVEGPGWPEEGSCPDIVAKNGN
jgi:hypothetical protein